MTKLLFRLVFLLLTPLAIAIVVFLFLRTNLLQASDPNDQSAIIVEISSQTDTSSIAKLLAEKRLIKAPWAFDVLTKISTDSAKIVAGEYELKRSMTPREILEKMRSGSVVKRRVAVKSGDTIWTIASSFEEAGIRDRSSVLSALQDQDLLTRAGIRNTTFEGYLYVGNYQFSKTEGMPQIIWKMLETGENVWDQILTQRAEELKLNRHEVITIASLIQAETENSDYQLAISGVLHNRLTNLMRLESEPALRYGLKNPDRELTDADFANAENPYNLFVHYGLPPGPICAVGSGAINAALNYQDHQYLFYLKDGSGGFMFAETLNEYVALKQKLADKK